MKKIGIIGAGQLGLMLGEAGQQLGIECIFLDPGDNPPAAAVGEVLQFAFDDAEGLQKLAAATDLVTYEFENIPLVAVEGIRNKTTVFPDPEALRRAQDRYLEKTLFQDLSIPIPMFQIVDDANDLRNACDEIGLPLVVKTRRLGYDGKGQRIIRSIAEIEKVMQALGSADLIAEELVPFDREVSAIGARDRDGNVVSYPLTENRHEDGILRVSRTLADSHNRLAAANEYLERLLVHLNYVGVVALEFFEIDGQLKANEFAPRVHNSGHWTIEGAQTSQFENHLRAVLDGGLGPTDVCGYAGMLNLIGDIPGEALINAVPLSHLHQYGKEPRPGRKLGHVTVVANSENDRDSSLEQLGKLLKN